MRKAIEALSTMLLSELAPMFWATAFCLGAFITAAVIILAGGGR